MKNSSFLLPLLPRDPRRNARRMNAIGRLGRLGQTGDAMIIGVVCLVVLILIVVSVGFYFATHEGKASVTYVPPAVTADDDLTQGNSNNELIQDARIINEGVKRDDTQRKAAGTALSDQAQAIGDSTDTSTTVEADRLSTLQTAFISEGDRRLKALEDASKVVPQLTQPQQDMIKKQITDETTAITGLKAKAAAESTFDAFAADKAALEKEYGNYLLAISQTYLLQWANGQSGVEDKVNVLGGKYQERLNDAGNQGKDTAQAQVLVNTYQASKTTANGLTSAALKSVTAVKPGDYNANRSVLKTYYSQLSNAHDELGKVLTAASGLSTEMAKFSAQ